MHQRINLWIVCLIGLTAITAVVGAQNEPPQPEQPDEIELELIPVGADGSPVSFTQDVGAGKCEDAPELSIPGGDQMNVSSLPSEPTDPVLSCMWGNPSRPQGYRTVWYKFVPPDSGEVRISTFNSQYDTVLAVHTGTCDNLPSSLATLACSDDTNGFTSELRMDVVEGVTYYVEVADWHQAVDDPTLNISVLMTPLSSNWEQDDPMPSPRSRHASALVGIDLYMIGGQAVNVDTGSPSKRLDRFNTVTGDWTRLADMPGQTGYAYAAAAYYGGRIYMPSGVVNAYRNKNGRLVFDVNGTHWMYTLANDSWTTVPAAPWPGGVPWVWSAAVTSQNPSKQGYYLIGGLTSPIPFTTTVQVTNEMLFYSTYTNDWHVEPAMTVNGSPHPLYGHTAAWVGGRVCVAGGWNDFVEPATSGLCFNDATNTWTATGPLNQPRYGATSAVGPDGRWYIFGGVGENELIAETEVYNPQTNQWTLLKRPYDVGGLSPTPPRAWARSAFANDAMWVLGGDTFPESSAPLAIVEKLYFPPWHLFFPYLTDNRVDNDYDHFGEAHRLVLNQAQYHNFEGQLDRFDVFYFDLPDQRSVRVRLRDIPATSNFDIAIYDANKLLWGSGTNLAGIDEDVTLTLAPGRYYVMVERVFPLGEPDPGVLYNVKVEG